MLTQDLNAPKKQRHTARRILARLADEHGAADLSYSTFRDYVRKQVEPCPQLKAVHTGVQPVPVSTLPIRSRRDA